MPKADKPFAGYVQIRYHHSPAPCMVVPRGSEIEIVLDEPQRSVTPGQWAVVYDADGGVLVAGLIRAFDGPEVQDLGHEITRIATKSSQREFV
jgi:tRNA U34 2-thiouridine synthase MnmA/TrmU